MKKPRRPCPVPRELHGADDPRTTSDIRARRARRLSKSTAPGDGPSMGPRYGAGQPVVNHDAILREDQTDEQRAAIKARGKVAKDHVIGKYDIKGSAE